ncbi:MAG: Panacea domain-containing protein [Solirubrobacterales bacterium]
MSEPTYNHDKFAEMLLYVVSQVEHDNTNGDTKLNKLLYYADVTAYRKTGRAISGARYKHQTHGPIAIALWPVREELEEQERLKVSENRLPNNAVQRRTYALDEVDTDLFDDGELEIVDEVIERFRGCKAEEMAAFAHEEPAWRMTEDEEEMTYRSSLLVRNPTPAATAFGGQLAERLGL